MHRFSQRHIPRLRCFISGFVMSFCSYRLPSIAWSRMCFMKRWSASSRNHRSNVISRSNVRQELIRYVRVKYQHDESHYNAASYAMQQEDGDQAATFTTEEGLRQEIDLLRKEMDQVPLETVKWKAAAENAQRQLDALVDEKGLGKCACKSD